MPLIKEYDSSVEETSIEQAFKKVGGLGKFHTFMFAALATFIATGEVYNSLIMYFNKVPDMLCTMRDGQTVSCDWETACFSDNTEITGIQADLDQWDTFDNLVGRTNIMCYPKSYAGYFGVFLTLGTAVGSVILPYLADVVGRKLVL